MRVDDGFPRKWGGILSSISRCWAAERSQVRESSHEGPGASGQEEGVIQSDGDATLRVRGFLERLIRVSFFELCLDSLTQPRGTV